MKKFLGVFWGILCLVFILIFVVAIVFRDRRPEIYFAAEKGDLKKIGEFISSGGDVNRPIFADRTGFLHTQLLNVAVQNGQVVMVDLLLKSGANPNSRDSRNGDGPLHTAVAGRTDSKTEDQIRILELLLKGKSDPDLKSASSGYTPLLEAASLGRSEAVRILLKAGANVNATNTVGQTALHLAADSEIAELLLNAGADPAIRSQSGETPAESAAREKKFEVLGVLTNAFTQTNRINTP